MCVPFQVTKPTIYDWVKHGKLKPYKIRSGDIFFRAGHSAAAASEGTINKPEIVGTDVSLNAESKKTYLAVNKIFKVIILKS